MQPPQTPSHVIIPMLRSPCHCRRCVSYWYTGVLLLPTAYGAHIVLRPDAKLSHARALSRTYLATALSPTTALPLSPIVRTRPTRALTLTYTKLRQRQSLPSHAAAATGHFFVLSHQPAAAACLSCRRSHRSFLLPTEPYLRITPAFD